MSRDKRISAFTSNMSRCIVTGRSPAAIYWVFDDNRFASEEFGYIVPLCPELMPGGFWDGPDVERLRQHWKIEAQKDFEKKHGTRERFVFLFKKNYLEDKK